MTREEAIEVYHGLINTKIKEAFEFFAPELAESEDEMIRKRLITLIRVLDSSFFTGNNPSKEQCLAYLEKHKEQNLIMANSPQLKEQKPEESKVDVKILKDIDLALRGLYDALQAKNE